MNHYPDPTRRRGRPLRNPSDDKRTPEEIAWWNTNVSDPNRAHAKPLPLNAPLPDKLPNPWLLDSELLLRKLEQCRELVMQIPISNPAATHEGIKIAVTTISNLQSDLRLLAAPTPRRPTLICQERATCGKAPREKANGARENRFDQGIV